MAKVSARALNVAYLGAAVSDQYGVSDHFASKAVNEPPAGESRRTIHAVSVGAVFRLDTPGNGRPTNDW